MNVRTLGISFRSTVDPALEASWRFGRSVARTHARNFYYGMMLTPEPRRSALYAIYAWMRAVDDLVDSEEPTATKRAQLDAFSRATLNAIAGEELPADTPTDPKLWPAVARAVADYQIPTRYFQEMIDGQWMDQQQKRYQDFDSLRRYCYHVASTVGLVCIAIWGYRDGQETRQLAIDRGIALQLTNILRDIAEDAGRDRIYLPAEDLAAFDLDEAAFLKLVREGRPDARFLALMEHQISRARSYYDSSSTLERRLDPSCRATCWSMMRIYRGLLDQIAARPDQVLKTRLGLSKWSKLAIAFAAAWHRGKPH